jgi:sucrose phosphorylase
LAGAVEILADLIVNHVSSDSPPFRDYAARGAESPFAGLFLSLNRVLPQGAREADLLRIYRPRPGLPLAPLKLATGETRLSWTTFTPQHLDIDVWHPRGVAYRLRFCALLRGRV